MKINNFFLILIFALSIPILFSSCLGFFELAYRYNVEFIDDPPGTYRTTQQIDAEGSQRIVTGKRANGLFAGPVQIVIKDASGMIRSVESANFVRGVRCGVSKVEKADGTVFERHYENGRLINIEGSITQSEIRNSTSTYEVLKNTFPWYLEQFFTEEDKYERFRDFLFEVDDRLDDEFFVGSQFFGEMFEDVIYDIEEDDLFIDEIIRYEEIVFVEIFYDFYNFEFRRALHDSYFGRQVNTYEAIRNTYTELYDYFLDNGHSTIAVEEFCADFESSVDALVDLNVDHPMFTDSLDSWMIKVLEDNFDDQGFTIHSKEREFLRLFSGHETDLGLTNYELYRQALRTFLLGRSDLIADDLIEFIEERRFDNNHLVLATQEAYLRRNGHVVPPFVTLMLEDVQGGTFSLRGNILLQGSEEITETGFVWDTIYTPGFNSFRIIASEQNGEFRVNINDFEENRRYFIRAYAVYEDVAVFSSRLEINSDDFPSSIETIPNTNIQISIFPNPTSSEINIHFVEEKKDVELIITDNQGRMIMMKEYDRITQISENLKMPSGIYYISIGTDKGQVSSKLIIE
ncbi:MAG: T9SS C-terminal target domain-containing protein [Saprospirales bacterium]|nr:MAG: T9SS C-terminal target domain-containing protein [Saprospirales bacterium]